MRHDKMLARENRLRHSTVWVCVLRDQRVFKAMNSRKASAAAWAPHSVSTVQTFNQNAIRHNAVFSKSRSLQYPIERLALDSATTHSGAHIALEAFPVVLEVFGSLLV
jgi:hypothetical protein